MNTPLATVNHVTMQEHGHKDTEVDFRRPMTLAAIYRYFNTQGWRVAIFQDATGLVRAVLHGSIVQDTTVTT